MGLDTTIYQAKIKTEIEQIFDNLIEADEEMTEAFYWRKNHNLLEWFRYELNREIENCEKYELTRENFVNLLKALKCGELSYANDDYDNDYEAEEKLDIVKLTKFLKEADFETTKFYFSNWW